MSRRNRARMLRLAGSIGRSLKPGGGVASSASGSRPYTLSTVRVIDVTVSPCSRMESRTTRPTPKGVRHPPSPYGL